MFSQVCVLPFHRRPYPELQVRLANARMDAGKLIDANVSLAVIRLIPTPEGGLERHVEDLPLLQSKHPLFQLTWNIVHVLGPDSPLVDKSHPFSRADLHLVDFEAILCSISAIEDKYAQTVHARRIYLPDDFRVACTFKTMRLEPAANRGEILLDLSQIGAYERQQPDSDARASNGSEWRPSNSALCDAAAKGDVGSVHRLLQDRAVDAASADYDGRTVCKALLIGGRVCASHRHPWNASTDISTHLTGAAPRKLQWPHRRRQLAARLRSRRLRS